VAIRLCGNARSVIHGPVPSSAAADNWLHDRQLYEAKTPVQWRILTVLCYIVWRNRIEAMAFEGEE
jgi:hypothetical protein